jgi:hypothetical protein
LQDIPKNPFFDPGRYGAGQDGKVTWLIGLPALHC